jgi:hypothetical protein
MNPRPHFNTLESLRTTLQKLEQSSDSDQDEASMAELKRVLLNRIADLELSQALERTAEITAEPPLPSELVPPTLAAEADPSPTPLDSAALEKLD